MGRKAREILNTCANVWEILLYGKDTMWAENLPMNEYVPDVYAHDGAGRWKNALAAGADALIAASPPEYEVLANVKPESMELYSIEKMEIGGLY